MHIKELGPATVLRMRTTYSELQSSMRNCVEPLDQMSEKKQTVDLGLLEEDDEFEEFPAEGEWTEKDSCFALFSQFTTK